MCAVTHAHCLSQSLRSGSFFLSLRDAVSNHGFYTRNSLTVRRQERWLFGSEIDQRMVLLPGDGPGCPGPR